MDTLSLVSLGFAILARRSIETSPRIGSHLRDLEVVAASRWLTDLAAFQHNTIAAKLV